MSSIKAAAAVAPGNTSPDSVYNFRAAASDEMAFHNNNNNADSSSTGDNNNDAADQSADQQRQQQQQRDPPSRRTVRKSNSNELESLEYSSHADAESEQSSYIAIHTLGQESLSAGGGGSAAAHFRSTHEDATETVHEMHLALLYLLSNPEEFSKALASRPPNGATTLREWNNEYNYDEENESTALTDDNESAFDNDGGGAAAAVHGASNNQGGGGTPLPFVVFADDAEVVLPQAHTASQLFGVERIEGIELEAAAGIPAISQLFLRWLALMPAGDHLNVIDPPGITVMRIAGGRYRVTAAHRVVWTWNNQFAPFTTSSASADSTASRQDETFNHLQIGDLVGMTIVDVFETDNQGKLLSYCPTFDNRAIYKTSAHAETLRKSRSKLMTVLAKAQKSKLAMLIVDKAQLVAQSVKQKVGEAVNNYGSPTRGGAGSGSVAENSGISSSNVSAQHDHLSLCSRSRDLDDVERYEA